MPSVPSVDMSDSESPQSTLMQNLDRELGESLRTAVIRNESQRIKSLLKKINFDYVLDANRKTALYLASQYGSQKVVRLLLSYGANPNHRCIDGSTPVHAACYSGEPDIVSLLVEAGGDIRLHDNDGRGVKDWAMKHVDAKKARAVLLFIEELYRQADTLNRSDSSESPGATLGQKKKRQRQQVSLKKHVGFGAMGNWLERPSGEPSVIPVVSEASLTCDKSGLSYRIGTYVVMESMFWNKIVPVTIKRLRRVAASSECYSVDELINENNYMLHIRHPNILLLLAVCPVDRFENVYLVYERISLGSLHTLVHHKGVKFSKKSAYAIMAQVCSAVSYLHFKDLVHCYITPSAVQVMSSYESVKLGNFEFMVDGKASEGKVPVTRSFPTSDTNWLAPEIFVEKAVSKKSDVYGVGVVLWEILHDKKPFAGLITSEVEFLVMEARGRVLAIDSTVDMPFSMLLDLALKCHPDQRSCQLKDIHDALVQKLTAMTEKEPHETKIKSTSADKQCSLSCLLISDQAVDSGELSSLQDAEDTMPVEQREWRDRRQETPSEQREPSGSVGDGLTIDETPVTITGGARLHKVKAASRLVKEKKTHQQGETNDDQDTDNIVPDVNLGVSDEDLPSVVTEADPFEVDYGWPASKRDDRKSPVFFESAENFFRRSSVLPEQVGAGPDLGNTVANGAGFVTVFDKAKSSTGTAGGVEQEGEASEKQADEAGGKVVLDDTTDEQLFASCRSQLSFEKFLEGNAAPSNLELSTFCSELGREFDIKTSSSGDHDVTASDQEPSVPAKELSYTTRENLDKSARTGRLLVSQSRKIFSLPADSANRVSQGDLMSIVDGGGLRESSSSRAAKNSLSSLVDLRHSIESMKRAFFCSDCPASTSRVLLQSSSADMKAGAVGIQRSGISSAAQGPGVASASSFVQQETLLVSPRDLTSNLTASESSELLKAFANKPLPPLPRTYIKPIKTERQVSDLEPRKDTIFQSDHADHMETNENSQWIPSPLQKVYLKETRVYSHSSRPNTVFGLRTQMTGSRLFESPDIGDAARTRQSESFQNFGLNSGLVLHRVPDADISAIYRLPADQVGSSRPHAANFDFMTGFKPASHHTPSMVAPHLSKRTNEPIVTGAAFAPSGAPARLSWFQEDSTGRAEYRFMSEQQRKEKEQDPSPPKIKERSTVKKSSEEKQRKLAIARELEEKVADGDVGSKQKQVETSELASSMASESQPLVDDIQEISAVKSTTIVSSDGYSSGSGQNAVRESDTGPEEELVGDSQVMTSKQVQLSGANLEVQDTQRREPHHPGALLPKFPVMKVGTSLTIPSDRVSRLIGDADVMHRFKLVKQYVHLIL